MKEKQNDRKDTLKEDRLRDQGKMGELGICGLELAGRV
jgi:hypothetical protein